jgi:tetratricopeptide (TPR) repeat protein
VPGALLYVLGALAGLAQAASPAAPSAVLRCQDLVHHGHVREARACHEALTREGSIALRAEGYWGLRQFEEANQAFRQAVGQAPANALLRVRWGLLLHERFNNQDAQDLFKEALSRDPRNAQAMLGLALVAADGFDGGAGEWAAKALAQDPQLVAAHELLARLALEDSDAKQAALEADAALVIAPDALDALAVHASLDLLNDRSPEAWFAKIRAINPVYGGGYGLTAHFLVLATRYTDAVAYYRKALEVDPELWSAHSELGINLMRLGDDTAAREELRKSYEAGYRDAATVNSLRLLDSYKNFVIVREGNAILRLHRKESELLAPYFMAELKRDIADYSRKYQMQLPGPVQVEVYPDHEDFVVRTLGLPGMGGGLLGVTFGTVVAMDSPSGRKPGEFHWASTLRHEMSHVFVLTATHHRVARWFTEGLAVHEETAASPEWGDPVTPDILKALKEKKLLPVASLDRGFVHPQYPSQVIVSYFQGGAICDYIASRWGEGKLLDLVHAWARVVSTPEVIRESLGLSPEDFDRDFQTWVYARFKGPIEGYDDWHERLSHLHGLARQGQPEQLISEGEAVIRLYPQYVYEENAYELVAAADLARGDKAGAAGVLSAYVAAGGRAPASLVRLAGLQEELGDGKAAASTLERINYIDPAYDPDAHRRLGLLLTKQARHPEAIRELSAAIAAHPHDMAAARYDLAEAYFAAGQRDKAQDADLAALEIAPGYKPAQQLLLKLTDSKP